MEKVHVKPFNSLEFEERRKISYYNWEEKVLTLKQVISMLDDSIGQYQKRKLRKWIKDIEDSLSREYIVDGENENNETNS